MIMIIIKGVSYKLTFKANEIFPILKKIPSTLNKLHIEITLS